MEAKDTVMTDDEVKEELKKYDIPEVFLNEGTCKQITSQTGNIIAVVRKAQAEISFKSGMKEVVEWIKTKQWSTSTIIIEMSEWQAQKEVWGIE